MVFENNVLTYLKEASGGFWSEKDWDLKQGILPESWSANDVPHAIPDLIEMPEQEKIGSEQAYFRAQPHFLTRLKQFFDTTVDFKSLWVCGSISPSSFPVWVKACLLPVKQAAEAARSSPESRLIPLFYGHQYDRKTLQGWIRKTAEFPIGNTTANESVWVLNAAGLAQDKALAQKVLNWLYPTDLEVKDDATRGLIIPKIKVILIGEIEWLETLEQRYPAWSEVSLQVHLSGRHLIDTAAALKVWVDYTQWLLNAHCAASGTVCLELDAWRQLIWLGQRYCDNGNMLPLEVGWAPSWVKLASTFQEARPAGLPNEQASLSLSSVCLQQAAAQESSLKALAEREALIELSQRQMFIKLQGEQVGCIYGVWVISSSIGNRDFGMPFRLNCVVYKKQGGEGMELGEVVDIEDKVSFSGPCQTKGTLIMQNYLAHALQLPHPLGVTAAFSTEQNYQKSDGDSGTLAALCCWISALTQIPLKQSMVMTGSIDLLGNVQPVGGINQKVEGVFACCKLQGFPKNAGIVIPASNQLHLLPTPEVLAAISEGKFRIIPVTCVEQALVSVLNLPSETLSSKKILWNYLKSKLVGWIEKSNISAWERRKKKGKRSMLL